MKIQELAIIFILIILPISLLLSEYTQFRINTLNKQIEYDAKLTSATYDAIKAFQLNSTNSTTSDLANSKLRDLEASVNAFRNSIMSAFNLSGYEEEALNNYIPALVYTLYDGFYIYSPYENTHNKEGNRIDGELDAMYGLKPYISYSCRYVKGNIDVVITYALDNHITVQGMMPDESGNTVYVNKSGYLIDNITVGGNAVTYNGVTIGTEQLKEHIWNQEYNYAKINGTKYYLVNDQIISFMNGTPIVQFKEGQEPFDSWKKLILNNDSAKQYYKDAHEFTEWFKGTGLIELTYGDAIDEVIDNGTTSITNVWGEDNDTYIFKDDVNIENETSNFNQHRLAVIRHKIETNLAIAVSNYNEYSRADNVFQMPELKEDEWEHITHNISLISFLQGLNIGGKIYNGYSLVTNSESKEVVLEDNIYILGRDATNKYNYHKIGDNGLNLGGSITVDASVYGDTVSAGRLNLDFKRNSLNSGNGQIYYYPLKIYNASYDSVIMQNNVTTYEDIYQYVNGQEYDVKAAFYTALGRERYGMYRTENNVNNYFNSIEDEDVEDIPQDNTPEDNTPEETPVIEYTIKFVTNDWSFANGDIVREEKKKYGEEVILPNSAEFAERTGYTFAGWKTSSGVAHGGGTSYTCVSDETFYAVWQANTYQIALMSNGGTFLTDIISDDDESWNKTSSQFTATVTYGTPITIPTLPPTRLIGGTYKFLGYGESVTATTVTYQPGDTITVTSNVTLYALWQEEQENEGVTITYKPNGATGLTRTQTFNEGEAKTVYSNTYIRNGYTFKEWNTSSDGKGESIDEGTSIKPTQNMTLYAIWEKISGDFIITPVVPGPGIEIETM